MQPIHVFLINRTWLATGLVVIVLCSSAVALGIHYSNDNLKLDVVISATTMTFIEGQNTEFQSNISGASGPYIYSWDINSTFYSSSRDANLTFYGFGIHVITLYVSSVSGISGSDTILIHVDSAPDVFITSNVTNITKGESVSFNSTIDGGIGPYFYTWYVNGNPIGKGFNLTSIDYSFLENGTYNIGLRVNDSLGFYGSTKFNYDPWKFSQFIAPSVRPNYPTNNAMTNLQQQNASGNLIFHFFLFNPLSNAGEDNITVALFPDLPSKGPNSDPTMNFTFSSGLMPVNTSKWVTVNPHIYWNYSSLAVIPQVQTGLAGDEIGVANPASFNNIFSHYWVPGWDASDDGFVGFWTISHNLTIEVG